MENLRPAEHGGQIRLTVAPMPCLVELQTDQADRAAQPGNLAEDLISNNTEHSEYVPTCG